eukprot:3444671-Alexandrium_andersonii.AAC.1
MQANSTSPRATRTSGSDWSRPRRPTQHGLPCSPGPASLGVARGARRSSWARGRASAAAPLMPWR